MAIEGPHDDLADYDVADEGGEVADFNESDGEELWLTFETAPAQSTANAAASSTAEASAGKASSTTANLLISARTAFVPGPLWTSIRTGLSTIWPSANREPFQTELSSCSAQTASPDSWKTGDWLGNKDVRATLLEAALLRAALLGAALLPTSQAFSSWRARSIRSIESRFCVTLVTTALQRGQI